MKNINCEKIENGNPASIVKDDEMLIVLGKAGQKRSPWIGELRNKALGSLCKTQLNTVYNIGYLEGKEEIPFLIVDWIKEGNSSLERRYVMGRLAKIVRNQFAVKKFVFFLEEGSEAEQIAMVEDFVTGNSKIGFEGCAWQSVRVVSPSADALKKHDPFKKSRYSANINYRKWINTNPDEMTSITIGNELKSFAKAHGCEFESLEEEDLRKNGLNLLLAVGQASELSPSRLHLVSHNVKKGDKPVLLVGKGVTFDTGGINVKAFESFVNCMKNDMGGSALMSHLFMAMVESGYKGPLALAIPCCENLVAQKSMKPGAVVKSHSGKSVVVEHTDAEGRLILADALSYASEKWDPAQIIVAATLTTAALRQFTNFFTPVHFADQKFKESLSKSSHKWGEAFTFWDEFLPFALSNQTQQADLTNMGRMPGKSSIGGGSSVAAHFLKEFVVCPMIHIDIFATTWNWSGDYPGAQYGATGAAFNSLFETLMFNAKS